MPKIEYKTIRMSPERLALVEKAIEFITFFRSQGYSLTLRQLYYRFVAQDAFPASWADPETGSTNNERSYKKLGDIIGDARMGGLIDWNAIEDRTREVDGNSHWDSPADIIASSAQCFLLDKWDNQPNRVEVWVEKDALEGVVGKVSRRLDVQFFSCRGFASATSLWEAGQRLKEYAEADQRPVILHLGDHDPSGIDMSRDLEERVSLFMDDYGGDLEFVRIALNRDQIDEYNPPPNPAKQTDSRYRGYVDEHGEECWELDALDPSVIDALIQKHVLSYRDDDLFEDREAEEAKHRERLGVAAKHWENGLAKHIDKLAQKKKGK